MKGTVCRVNSRIQERLQVIDEREEGSQDERRLHDRSRLIVDVFFNGADSSGVASTRDISPGGLYMNSKAEIPEGAVLTLRIPVGDGHVVVNGKVMYSNPGHGVGVRFQGLTESDRVLLERQLQMP